MHGEYSIGSQTNPVTCLKTYADLRKSEALLGYRPQVDIATGLQRFATWFRAYYQT